VFRARGWAPVPAVSALNRAECRGFVSFLTQANESSESLCITFLHRNAHGLLDEAAHLVVVVEVCVLVHSEVRKGLHLLDRRLT
jgi:hypothetical protein